MRVAPSALQAALLVRLWDVSRPCAAIALLALVRGFATRAGTSDAEQLRSSAEGSARVVSLVMHLPDWVAVLAVTPDERVVLVRQWRQAARRWVLEPPGGVIDEGDPVAAALRELREETGYAAAQARYVGAMFSDPSRNTNRLHVVVAEGVTLAGAPEREASEEMVVETMPLAELRAGYASGLLGNALHVAVVALALAGRDQP